MTTWPVHRNGDRNARANRRLAGFGWALCTLLAFVPWLARADSDPGSRLPGHVLAALSSASKSAPAGASDTDALTLTFVLRRDDEAGFQRYLADVYDPASSEFHRFLSQDQLAQRFGPSQDAYDAVLAFAGAAHFAVSQRSENRLTLSVRASRADVERALALRIDDYTIDGRNFYANDADPLLPAEVAARVQAIAGLSNLAQPIALTQSSPPGCGGGGTNRPDADACDTRPCMFGDDGGLIYKIFCVWTNWGRYDPPKALSGSRPDGSGALGGGDGQTVGLVEFDTFDPDDVAGFIGLMQMPASEIDRVSAVHVNGGATLGAGESEVLLDIDTILSIAPGANIAVYDAPLSGSGGFQAIFNAMIDDGVTVISNSWAYCENQTTLADVESIDAILESAAASGISVFNGAGDTGSACLNGAAGTVAVPADVPSATAVGGTTPDDQIGTLYGGETWWNGSDHVPATGQGGFGTSIFFSRPAYQNAVSFSPYRSVPDVASNADPATGVMICQADAGGCPTYLLYGGTSFAAPTWAGFAALLNAGIGSNIGQFNAAIYPFANTPAFHNAASMGTDFAHVGLGSPNLDHLYLALTGQSAGAVSTSNSEVHAGTRLPDFIGTPAPTLTIAADGTSVAPVVVRLYDANGHSIGGKTVHLAASSANAIVTPSQAVTSSDDGAATFAVTDDVAETVTFTATDSSDGLEIAETAVVEFVTPPAASGSIVAFTDAAPADGVSTDLITVTLADGLGRPTPGKRIALSQTGNSVVSGPVPPVTNDAGQIVFTITDTVQETIVYTAIDASDGDLDVPGSAVVTFNASGGDNCGITHLDNPDVHAGPGYAIAPFATGFVPLDTNFGGLTDGCRGASGLAFDAVGNLYVSDLHSGNLYRFGAAGGEVGPATLITPTPLGPGIEALAFGHDGKLYAAQNATTGNFFTGAVLEINPATGAITRTVAESITCASFLATDPASGDLFVNDSCAGGGSENGSVWRIENPGSASPTTTVYTSTPGVNGGMSISTGGTLYMLSYRDNGGAGGVVAISGTASATPGQVTVVPGITGPALGITATGAQANGDAEALTMMASPGTDGFAPGIRSYDITGATAATTSLLMENAYANVQVTGPDGCLYVSVNVAVYRITNADGSCPLRLASPQITLSPSTIAPDPAQGTSQTFTASFHYVDVAPGTAVTFEVRGANPGIRRALVGGDGTASFSYVGRSAGRDTIVASAIVGGETLTSDPSKIDWSPGAHATYLGLNASPTSAFAGWPVRLVANLADVSGGAIAGISGATVSFLVDGQSCNGVSDASGAASCTVVVPDVGAFTLTATYAGSAAYLPASATQVLSTTAASDEIFADGFDGDD
jgi:kumamolisin